MPRITICLVAAAACAVSPALTSQEPLYVLRGKAPNSQYGSSVTSAGDVDQDGFPDLVIGAPIDRRTTEKSGAAEVRSGRTNRLLYTWLGPGPGDELGFGASGAGDVDADGYDDVIVGVLGGVGPERSFIGHARVYSGRDGDRLHTFEGQVHYDFYGLAVGGVGDVDGDGNDDFAIGCPGGDANGDNSGYLEVRSGGSGEVIHTLLGDAPDDQFGWFVRSVGDVDDDGVPDMLVGAPGHLVEGKKGYARLFSGSSGEVLVTVRGEHDGDRLGWSVARIGDVDGDGKPDLLIGAPFHDASAPDCGAVYLFSGATGTLVRRILGQQPGALFGWCVTGAEGDYDLDQIPDFWVGAKLEDANGEDSGAVHLVSAGSGAELLSIPGRSARDESGFSLVDLGPVLEGGDHALAVGARSDDLGTGEMVGSTAVYRIRPATTEVDAAHLIAGGGEVESFDVALIAPSEDPGGRDRKGLPWLAVVSTAVALIAILALFRRGS